MTMEKMERFNESINGLHMLIHKLMKVEEIEIDEKRCDELIDLINICHRKIEELIPKESS
jgi:mevalonate kinase